MEAKTLKLPTQGLFGKSAGVMSVRVVGYPFPFEKMNCDALLFQKSPNASAAAFCSGVSVVGTAKTMLPAQGKLPADDAMATHIMGLGVEQVH